MDLKNITNTVVVLLAVVVIISAVIIPIVEVAQKEQYSIEQNTSMLYMIADESSDTVRIETINSVAYLNTVPLDDLVDPTVTTTVYIWSENCAARSTYSTESLHWDSWYYVMNGTSLTTGFLTGTNYYLIFEDNTVTAYDKTDDSVYNTADYTTLMLPSSSGSYGAWDLSTPIFVDDESKIYGAYRLGNEWRLISGTVENLVPTLVLDSGGNDVTSTTTFTATSEKTDYNASNKLTAISPRVSIVFAPIDYTVISDEQSIYAVLYGVIPLLLLVLPIMIIVRSFRMGRD